MNPFPIIPAMQKIKTVKLVVEERFNGLSLGVTVDMIAGWLKTVISLTPVAIVDSTGVVPVYVTKALLTKKRTIETVHS